MLFTQSSTVVSEAGVSISFNGNVEIYSPSDRDNTKVTIPEGANIIIDGKLTVGDSTKSNSSSYLINKGTLTCLGDIEFYSYYGKYSPAAGSRLIAKKNIVYLVYSDSPTGTIELAGTEQQEIYLPVAYNVEVSNSNGIKYLTDLKLYGKYNLNGMPLELNGYYTYLYGNYSELDDSDFQEIRINSGYTLDYNIKGNVEIFSPSDREDIKVTVPEGSNVIIDGKLTVGDSTKSNSDSYLSNKGTLTCLGDIEFYSYYGNYSPAAGSRLIAKKNIVRLVYSDSPTGTIELAGTEQQEIYLPVAYNVEVSNSNGIKYLTDLKLYGKYNLNGMPLELNGYYTYLYGNYSELDDSDFQEIRINSGYTLDYNIKGNVEIFSPSDREDIKVTVPEGSNVIIDGKLTVGDSTKSNSDSYLSNKGTLTCLGDIEFYSYYGNYSPAAGSRLIAKKNIVRLVYSDSPTGTIELAGTEQQTVYLTRASIIEITNASNEGVLFTSSISVNKLFDHNGNNFTLYNNGSGSTFVDYDGDGLLDNVDPHPTIHENCISGHAYSEWTQTKASTCVAYGEETRTCTVCGEVEIKVVEPTGMHIFDNDEDKQCNTCDFVRYVVGDINGNEAITDADAMYLLMHTYFPEDYPISQPCDFDGDGKLTDSDAIYLLFYTYFPEDYPLPEPPFSYVDSVMAVVNDDE